MSTTVQPEPTLLDTSALIVGDVTTHGKGSVQNVVAFTTAEEIDKILSAFGKTLDEVSAEGVPEQHTRKLIRAQSAQDAERHARSHA